MGGKSNLDRRQFVKVSGLAAIGFLGLQNGLSASSLFPIARKAGFGPLSRDPKKILNLPSGFSYKVISKAGDKMDDGFFVPGQPDGMATFPGPDGKTIIIRNHENSPDQQSKSPFGSRAELLDKVDPDKVYDRGSGIKPCAGGTTTLVFDTATQTVEKEFLSLAGTIRNCAGGPTPWGSWISCEETTQQKEGTVEKDHGYVFEVPATAEPGLADPIPIKAMGRFNHEAIAVDPKSGVVYLTEDIYDGLFYRFVPKKYGKLNQGGRLEALAIKDRVRADTRNWPGISRGRYPTKKPLEVTWIPLEDIDSPDDDLRIRGFGAGAAKFARGEGIWFGDNELYFACTNGGRIQSGQIFRYKPSPFEGTAKEKSQPGTLELFIEPNNKNVLEYCDNLTIAPWGDLIICEDKYEPHIVGVTPQGKFYRLAKNVGFESEFAGVTFSPDGTTMFVNIQYAGLTFAITGPWKEGYQAS